MDGTLGRIVYRYVGDPNILNWSHIHKCVLVLVFFLFTKTLWIGWKIFALSSPEYHQYLNLDAMRFHLKIEIIEALITLFIVPCFHWLRDYDLAKKILPHICIGLITTSLVFDWYSSGLLAAGTVINAMDFLYLMIVLFDRKFLVTTLIYTVSIFILFLSSGMVDGEMNYAPLFNLANIGYPNFKNHFWLASTFYSSIPPLIVCVSLLGTILKQWRDREQYITQLSQRDGLTSIYNRRVLTETLMLLDQDHPDQPYAILLIDLDFFKAVNDTHGHIVGDHVLIDSARLIQQAIRSTDILGRYGGEEFLIMTKNTNFDEIQVLAERCRMALAEFRHVIDADLKIQVTCSIGVALSTDHQSAMAVLDHADQALYEAKINGRNQVCFG